MKQFKLDKKHTLKVVRECVDAMLNEEMGIADDVVAKTQEIKRLILRDRGNREKQKLDDGVSLTQGTIGVNVFGIEMNILYRIYNFRDYDTYYDKAEYFNPICGMMFEQKEMYISILSISGMFQENSFGDSIQHELEHIYQSKMKNNGLFQDNDLYHKAFQNINSNLYNGWVSKLANVIYYSRNEEHDAFVNGLYQQLVNLDSLDDFEYVIKTSTPYKISLLLTDIKNEIKDNYDNEDLLEASNFFKKPRRWFIAQCEIGIRKIIKKIMKVRMKANNDFLKVNEGKIFERPFGYNTKEMNDRKIENYYKNFK